MKTEKQPNQQDKGTKNIIQKKEKGSFIKPVGDTTKFSPPSTAGKRNNSLPNKLQSNMENSFGQDFSDVGIHKDSQKAVQMNARAYTQNEQIHFAPGEFNPESTSGQNLIGHEFTHIAQQRAGVVKPTKVLQKGVMVNDDKSLESEADAFGRKAAKGEAISKYRSASLEMRNSVRTAQAKSNVVQMVATDYGEFKDESYTTLKNSAGKEVGVDMYMKFVPGNNVDAKLIGLTQTVRSIKSGGKPININPTVGTRSITSGDAQPISSPTLGTDQGMHIDQHSGAGYRNPLYATGKISDKDTELAQAGTPSPVKKLTAAEIAASSYSGLNYKGWGEHGYRYKSGKVWKSKDAELHDAPKLTARGTNAEQLFETAALAIDGNQEGMYYGSVEWGWRTDAKGVFTRLPFKVKSKAVPTSTFMKAAQVWNADKTAGKDNIQLPAVWTGTIHNTSLAALRSGQSAASQILADLPTGTSLTVLDDSSNWLHVQLSTTQAGLILNRHGRAAFMTGDLIRGYVSKELVNKDASYVR